jgi:hypothetical protein
MGIFPDVDSAAKAARKAFEQYDRISIETRDKMIAAMRATTLAHVKELAQYAHEETGLGRIDDKIKKNTLVATKTPGTEILRPITYSGDYGLMITERAPYGVFGAITPTTNPTETIINNGISMIAGGNTVVFCPHPGARKVAMLTIDLINQGITVPPAVNAAYYQALFASNIAELQELRRVRQERQEAVAEPVRPSVAAGKDLDGRVQAQPRQARALRPNAGCRLHGLRHTARRVLAGQTHFRVAVESRLRERPERMEQLLHGVYEARVAHAGRVLAASRWREGRRFRWGYAILERGGMVITMHYVDRAGLDTLLRKHPVLLWRI